MSDLKQRVTDWPTTILGLGVLSFLSFLVWLNPELGKNPLMLIPLAGGLYAIFTKRRTVKDFLTVAIPDSDGKTE